MDPTSYSMTVIDCTVRLVVYHNLSLPELHSVQMAFQVLPHTCLFFGVASEMLLRIEPKRIPTQYRNGCGFGYLLSNIIIDLFLLSRESGVPQKYRRWSNYREPSVPTTERWDEVCHETTVYCLHVFAAYTDASSKKVRAAQYKSICSTISEIWDGVGVLVANHSVNQKACLGLLLNAPPPRATQPTCGHSQWTDRPACRAE
jgi:hypothetical protein